MGRFYLAVLLLVLSQDVASFSPVAFRGSNSEGAYRRGKRRSSTSSTSLNYYESDEPLSARLRVIGRGWDNIKSEGFQKFFIDELNAAEKAVVESLNTAEKIAEEVINQKIEASGGSAGRAFETAIMDTIDAAEAVAEAAANGAKSEALAVRDLKAVSEDMLKKVSNAELDIEKVVQQASENPSRFDNSIMKTLKSSETEVRESIKAAEDVAKTVEQVAKKDESALKEIGEVAQQLVKKIEATEVAADSSVQKGTVEEKIVSSLENIANDVVKEMKDSEDLAMSVSKVAEADAKSIEAIETKASEVVDSIVKVEKALQAAPSESKASTVFEVATQAEEIIKSDEKVLEDLVQNIGTDAAVEDVVVAKLQAADTDMESMVKAAEEVVKTEDEITLVVLEEKEKIAQSSIEQVDLSKSECEECAVKAEERALNSVQASGDAETAIEGKAVAQSEAVEVDTPVVEQADSIEAELKVNTGDEKVTAVSSTQKEVTTDVKESLDVNTNEMNSMQNEVEKPTELASSKLSYPTDEKIVFVEDKNSETSVEPFANALKENEGSIREKETLVNLESEPNSDFKIEDFVKDTVSSDLHSDAATSGEALVARAEESTGSSVESVTSSTETIIPDEVLAKSGDSVEVITSSSETVPDEVLAISQTADLASDVETSASKALEETLTAENSESLIIAVQQATDSTISMTEKNSVDDIAAISGSTDYIPEEGLAKSLSSQTAELLSDIGVSVTKVSEPTLQAENSKNLVTAVQQAALDVANAATNFDSSLEHFVETVKTVESATSEYVDSALTSAEGIVAIASSLFL